MFLGDFLEEIDMSLEEVGEKMGKNPFKLLPKMIYLSAKTEADIKGDDFDYELKDIIDMIEKAGGLASPQVTKFVSKWTASLTDGVPESPAEEGNKEPKK